VKKNQSYQLKSKSKPFLELEFEWFVLTPHLSITNLRAVIITKSCEPHAFFSVK